MDSVLGGAVLSQLLLQVLLEAIVKLHQATVLESKRCRQQRSAGQGFGDVSLP